MSGCERCVGKMNILLRIGELSHEKRLSDEQHEPFVLYETRMNEESVLVIEPMYGDRLSVTLIVGNTQIRTV